MKMVADFQLRSLSWFTFSLFLVLLGSPRSWAVVRNAASCSLSDVTIAYSAAVAGDTVTVPAGICTWSSTLNVTKSITLQGAGATATVITNSMGSGSTLISISPSADILLTRVTGFGFQLGTINNGRGAIAIDGKPNTSFVPTKIRIDSNSVTGGGGNPGAFVTKGLVNGLIDHNTFTNVLSAIFGWGIGYDNQAWIDAFNAGGILAGTSNAMFVENNTFLLNAQIGTRATVDAQIYIQEGGASYVVRYNKFDASALPDPNYIELMYNNHGNQDYCLNFPGTCFRAAPIFESYSNTGICSATNCEFMSIRGGSALIHDETFQSSGTTAPGAIVKFDEEECWQSAFFSPLRTQYPAQDQVTNSFVWNVKYNRTTISDVDLAQDNGSCVKNFIVKNRDYFMHPPQSSGGRTVFTGSRYGGSMTAPTTGDNGSMSFSSSGANAYYPYTPFTYPHPLTGVTPPNPILLSAPSNLRLVAI